MREYPSNDLMGRICTNNKLPAPDFAFILSDDDNPGEDLSLNTVYFSFSEHLLYTCLPTKEHSNLEKIGISPEFSQWAAFG